MPSSLGCNMLTDHMLVLRNGARALQHSSPGSLLLSCDCSGCMQPCSADAAKVPGDKTVFLLLSCQHAHTVHPGASAYAAAGLGEDLLPVQHVRHDSMGAGVLCIWLLGLALWMSWKCCWKIWKRPTGWSTSMLLTRVASLLCFWPSKEVCSLL